jgi:hypothetical protein
MVDSGIVYYHLVNFPAIWSIFGPFRIFYGILVYFVDMFGIFSPFWYIVLQKYGNPVLVILLYI